MSHTNLIFATIAASTLPEMLQTYTKPILENVTGATQLPFPIRKGKQLHKDELIRDAALFFLCFPAIMEVYGITGAEVLAEVAEMRETSRASANFTDSLTKPIV